MRNSARRSRPCTCASWTCCSACASRRPRPSRCGSGWKGRFQRLEAAADEQARAARVAFAVESDDHIRGLLREELEARRRIDDLAPTLERLRANEGLLMDAVRSLGESVEEFAARMERLVARRYAAEATELLARQKLALHDRETEAEHAIGESHRAAATLAATDPGEVPPAR